MKTHHVWRKARPLTFFCTHGKCRDPKHPATRDLGPRSRHAVVECVNGICTIDGRPCYQARCAKHAPRPTKGARK